MAASFVVSGWSPLEQDRIDSAFGLARWLCMRTCCFGMRGVRGTENIPTLKRFCGGDLFVWLAFSCICIAFLIVQQWRLNLRFECYCLLEILLSLCR